MHAVHEGRLLFAAKIFFKYKFTNHCILVRHTLFLGSGKTLAYLLPLFERILHHNKLYGPVQDTNEPHGIIVTGSRELADQVAVSIFAVIHELNSLSPPVVMHGGLLCVAFCPSVHPSVCAKIRAKSH